MKKNILTCAVVCAAFILTGCKSQESAYRRAYEKAQAQEQATTIPETTPTIVAPVEQSSTETKVVDNYDNVPIRTENVSVVDGTGLKGYSVVVGSFRLKANAQGLKNGLVNAGYDARVVYSAEANNGSGMYRVVASSFDNKGDAVRSRDQLRSQYADAWLLFAK